MKRQVKEWGDPNDYADRHNAAMALVEPNRKICIYCRAQAVDEASLRHEEGCPATRKEKGA
jgi:hypothetical protein